MRCKQLTRAQLEKAIIGLHPLPRPKHANSHDMFISPKLALCLAMRSDKNEAKPVREWLLNDIIPRGFNKLIEEKQLAIKGHLQTIEEQQGALALLNDDLMDAQEHARQLEYNNTGLQGEIRAKDQQIETLIPRYVPKRGDYDNILVLISKNRPEEAGKAGRHPYYMIRCQKQSRVIQISKVKNKYPNMVVRDTCEDPNAIHEWCSFKDLVLEDGDYHRNHFSLNAAQRVEFEEIFEMQA